MESSIFAKYQTLISGIKKEKELIIEIVEQKTRVLLLEKDIQLNKKNEIKINLSASKRTMFIIRGGEEILKEKGYKVLFG